MSAMQKENDKKGERIAKFLARSGVGSRRDSEKLIEAGRISVNGKVLTSPAFNVDAGAVVKFDGNIVSKAPPRLWRYHKPSGLLTTNKDPQGRPTVFEALPKNLPRVMSVGRLDMTSEGLLLLTNDGELARALELPSSGFVRRYRVRAYGHIEQEGLLGLKKGITIDGIPTGPIEARLERQQGDNAWLNVSIREGKNREVRRALETVGLRVNRLIRLSYGPFQLSKLEKGGVEEVKNRTLRDQLGHVIDIPEAQPGGPKKPPLKRNFKTRRKNPSNPRTKSQSKHQAKSLNKNKAGNKPGNKAPNKRRPKGRR